MKRGITLIELVVALTLFLVFLGVFVCFLGRYQKVEERLTKDLEGRQNARAALNWLIKDVRNSKEIHASSSDWRLVLVQPDGQIIYEFKKDRLARNGCPVSVEKSLNSVRFFYPEDKIVRVEICFGAGSVTVETYSGGGG